MIGIRVLESGISGFVKKRTAATRLPTYSSGTIDSEGISNSWNSSELTKITTETAQMIASTQLKIKRLLFIKKNLIFDFSFSPESSAFFTDCSALSFEEVTSSFSCLLEKLKSLIGT